MKLLIVDFLCAEAHRTFNMNMVRAMAGIFNLSLVSVNGYYEKNIEELKKIGVRVLEAKIDCNGIGRVKSKYRIYKIMRYCSKEYKNGEYDFVISLAHDTLLSVFIPFLFHKNRIGIFHHKNIDELQTKIKIISFAVYKKYVIHFVFEDSFNNYLVDKHHVPYNRVFTIPHPIQTHLKEEKILKYDCIGLCHENDEKFIDELEAHEYDIERLGLRFLFRSKKERKSTNNFTFIDKFLEYSEYEDIISSSKSVFVPLPQYYIYRLSASIYDAFSLHKKVLTTSYTHAKEYSDKYPGICTYIEKPEELITKLKEFNEETVNVDSFCRFSDDHLIERVRDKIKESICFVLKR